MDLLNVREPFSAWSHGAWLILTLPGAWLLWRRAGGDHARRLILLGYASCLSLCATASTLYHGVRVPQEALGPYLLLDHIGIYILIAGTYTPIVWTLMRGRWRRGMLVATWLAAATGIVLNVAFSALPKWFSTALYLAMGWGSLFGYLELARTLSHRTLRPIVLGGVFYSVGAVIHVLNWPVIWPGVFGAHDLFHLLVVAGSATHFLFMLQVVAPWSASAKAAWDAPRSEGATAFTKATLLVPQPTPTVAVVPVPRGRDSRAMERPEPRG